MSKDTWEEVYRSAWTHNWPQRRACRDTIMRRAASTGLNKTKVIERDHAVLRRIPDRRRASAAVRFRAQKNPHAAALRHARRQSADFLSMACLRLHQSRLAMGEARSSLRKLCRAFMRTRPASYTDHALEPPAGRCNAPMSDFVRTYADKIPNTHGAPVREAAAG